jgi:hypothetical protein
MAAQVGGADLLSVLFADARLVAGVALVQKADRYFHGGLDIDYCDNSPRASGQAHARDPGPGRGESPDHDHSPDHGHDSESAASAAGDPWAWINARVHVQQHRHLDGNEVNEMVPWLWAACRADPRNVEAWEIAWYTLAKIRKLPEQGMAVLEAGIRENPGSAQLEFTRGQSLFSDFKDEQASEAAFLLSRAKALASVDGAPEKLGEDEAMLLTRTLDYLAFFAEKRGDVAALRTYYAEALAAMPDSASTRHLLRCLEAASGRSSGTDEHEQD